MNKKFTVSHYLGLYKKKNIARYQESVYQIREKVIQKDIKSSIDQLIEIPIL